MTSREDGRSRGTGERSGHPRRVVVRPIQLTDRAVFLANARVSHALHRQWIEVPITAPRFQRYVEELSQDDNRGFLVFRQDTGDLVGGIELRDIYFDNFRNSYVVYYGFVGQIGAGWMQAGLRQVIRFAFRELKLHRLEANIQLGNTASVALASACGFKKEGESPRFLKIRGRWRDFERWALLND